MPALFVPPLAEIYNDSVLSTKPQTAGLTEEDFAPLSFVSLALNEFGKCDATMLTKLVCFSHFGDVPDALPSVDEESLEIYSEATGEDVDMEDMDEVTEEFKAVTLGQFLKTQGNPEVQENQMVWLMLLYLGALAIAEDKRKLAADFAELGI